MEMSAKKQLFPRRVLELSVDALRPNPNQPRVEFDEDSLRALSDSIRRYGILQPLTVRRTDEGYELIAGERRLRAAKMAGLREVPVTVIEADDKKAMELALIENLQRSDLTPIEEARGYQQEKGWTILLIDARTGRMIDPEDETAGRYVYAL